MAEPKYPVLFYKPVHTLIGPDAPITIPKVVQPVEHHIPDYEVELTIVIGKPAKDVSEADALDYVLAYTGCNDVRVLNSGYNFMKLMKEPDLVPLPSNGSVSMVLLEGLR